MKHIRIFIACAVLFLAITPMHAKAGTAGVSAEIPKSNPESEKAQQLSKRLEEINAMDKSDMKRSEKRQLHKEVKAINKELKELGGGVYLSVGAVIIIILLLILLL